MQKKAVISKDITAETVKKGTDREEKEHSDLPPLVRGGVERSETEG